MMRTIIIYLIAISSLSTYLVSAAPVETQTNGTLWYDTRGSMLDASAMSFIKVGSYYYAFGNKRQRDDARFHYPFQAVNAYRSRNLRDWEFRGELIRQDDIPGPGIIAERAKVIYNPNTQKYVMWWKYKNNNDSQKSFGVAVSDRVDGQYSFVRRFYSTQGESGDFSLYTEGNRAYVVYSVVNGRDIAIDQLNSDFISINRNISILPGSREAPQLIKRNGVYYVLTSGVSGWAPNQGRYRSSRQLNGGWSNWKNFGDSITYDSQGADILEVQGTQGTTYIFSADRWSNAYLGESTRVWLPIAFNGENLSINYRDSFMIDTVTGRWSGAPAKRYYKIINRHSGKALTVFNTDIAGRRTGRDNNHVEIAQWDYDGAKPWFLWEIEDTSGGYKRVVNKFTNKAMTIFNYQIDGVTRTDRGSNFAEIGQWRFQNFQDFNHWRLDALGGGYFSFINKHSGRAMAVYPSRANGSSFDRRQNGADVGQYSFQQNQNWYYWRVEQVQ